MRLEVLVRLCWQREKTFLKAKKPVGEAEKGKVWDIDEKKKKKQQVALLGWDTVIKKKDNRK